MKEVCLTRASAVRWVLVPLRSEMLTVETAALPLNAWLSGGALGPGRDQGLAGGSAAEPVNAAFAQWALTRLLQLREVLPRRPQGFLSRDPAGILEGRHRDREMRISRELNGARRTRAMCWGLLVRPAGWPRSDVGAAGMHRARVLLGVVSLQNSNVGAPTPRTSGRDLI